MALYTYADGLPARVEILRPSLGDVDLEPFQDRYRLPLRVSVGFAA
jgi:hypothetical protein